MEEIKLCSGIEVKVNDKGETIIMNVEDQQFTENFYQLLDKMEQANAHMNSDRVKAMSEHDQLKESIQETKKVMTEIDRIFGENACRKVFGNIVPNMYLIADFFHKIEPIANKYMNKRREEINARYNRDRKGGAPHRGSGVQNSSKRRRNHTGEKNV